MASVELFHKCENCIHENVCKNVGKPSKFVEVLEKISEDRNFGETVSATVRCNDFYHKPLENRGDI